MAASDGYTARNIRWPEIHCDFGARRVIECAYNEACVLNTPFVEHRDPKMADEWKRAGERFATVYEFV